MKPRLLDLFCGAGGAAVGYHRAGFDIVGVDHRPQPNYPFTFIHADAFAALEPEFWLLGGMSRFDAIHASPPCQAYTNMNNRHGSSSPALISRVRELLPPADETPYVLENVVGARREMFSPYMLTGEMFGLRVHRPRLFETNFGLLVPERPPIQPDPVAVYGKVDGRRLWTRADGTELHAPDNLEEASEAMGIDWMTWDELREAIPPAYTELIGAQLLAHLKVAA